MDERLRQAEAIVFDVGQVLLSFEPEKVCGLLPEAHRAALYPVMFEGKERLWPLFDLGAESNETIARRIAEKAGCPEAWFEVDALLSRFPVTMHPLPMAGLLPELRQMGKRLYALTNYPEPGFTATCDCFPFLRELDGAVVSSREKLVKPDPAIFRLLCRRYGLIPKNTLFIDDVKENTDAAAKEGFHIWHYAGEDRIF